MEYLDQVRDFLKRSDKNLQVIQQQKEYEFTQLFSNFISALIVIKENRIIDKKAISENGLSCKVKKNTYKINFLENTQEFIRHLRNACCHYGIEIEDDNGEISKVIFRDSMDGYKKGKYNTSTNCKGKVFCNDSYNCLNKIVCCECEFELTIEEIEKVYRYLMSKI